MRILALDHGLARVGTATCDPTGSLVRPLEAIEPPDLGSVRDLVVELGARRVVVGIPVSLDGGESDQAQLARVFSQELAEALEVPVDTYDERLTTRMASRSRREGARADQDSLAAAHLLEAYLASRAREEIADE